jgi:uncharacterized protein
MAQDLIRYDILAQDALRGVIRKVLAEVSKAGLPGNHHFFITFLTGAPGVRVSSRLKEKYPEQMTIVLQHQFWDLQVSETGFEVGLSFGDVPERLSVPFSAVRGFYDPSVNFELEFEVRLNEVAANEDPGPPEQLIKEPAKAPAKEKRKTSSSKAAKGEAPEKVEDADKPSADVVSLDAFRKK